MRPRRALSWIAILPLLAAAADRPADAGSGGDDYQARLTRIETQRSELEQRLAVAPSAEARVDVIESGRRYLLTAIADQLIPPWLGTPWAYSGTADRPHGGSIACGFFVGTILAHAGFRLDRIRFGVLPAQTAIERLCAADSIAIFSNNNTAGVLARLASSADGVYLVGLDYHIGLVIKRGSELQLCHSTVLEPGQVLCEPAAGDNPLTSSGYVVVGALLTDARVEAWLLERPIALGGRR